MEDRHLPCRSRLHRPRRLPVQLPRSPRARGEAGEYSSLSLALATFFHPQTHKPTKPSHSWIVFLCYKYECSGYVCAHHHHTRFMWLTPRRKKKKKAKKLARREAKNKQTPCPAPPRRTTSLSGHLCRQKLTSSATSISPPLSPFFLVFPSSPSCRNKKTKRAGLFLPAPQEQAAALGRRLWPFRVRGVPGEIN